MFRNKLIASALAGFMLFGCAGSGAISINNEFLAPTSLIMTGEVAPGFIGNYISDKLIGYSGKALEDASETLLEKFFPGGEMIKSFPYPHAVRAIKVEINGVKQVVIVSRKRMDEYSEYYKASASVAGVTFISEHDFNTNIEFSGSTNQVSKVRISRPLVYNDGALEKYSYVIPKSEANREITKFIVGVQKAKEMIKQDESFNLSNKTIEAYVDEVVIKTGQGSDEYGPRVFKNVYSVMTDIFNSSKDNLPEEERDSMSRFVHLVADSLSNVHISKEEVATEIAHCNAAFKDKKNFFQKMAEENPEFVGIGMILDEVRGRVVKVIEKYNFTFEYALYCTFKEGHLVGDAQFAQMLDMLAQTQPHVMKDVELSVDYLISKASKFIGSLKPAEISDKLRKEEYALCSRVLDKVTTGITVKMDAKKIDYLVADKAFQFVEHVREQFNQILDYGYKGAFLAGVEIETNLEKLLALKADLKTNEADEKQISEIEGLIELFEEIGNDIITEILEQTEFSVDAPEEGFILFVDDMDAYVFSKFLEKYGDQIRGIVAQKGTSTSHWVISAGQKDIPVILGPTQFYGDPKKNIFEAVEKSGHVCIDGNNGVLVTNLDGDKLRDWIETQNWTDSVSEYFNGRVYEDTKIPLPVAVNFDADLNISSISSMELQRALHLAVGPLFNKYNVDKIGLVRTEYLYMMDRMLTDAEMQTFYNYMSSPDHVSTIRGFDYEADKNISAVDKLYQERGKVKPQNIFGAKYYYQDPTGIGRELIKKQLAYVYKAYLLKPDSKLRFMFPMVSSKEDIDEVMKIKDEVLAELSQNESFLTELADKHKFEAFGPETFMAMADNMEVGCMVETVLAVRNLDKINKAFDFTSIGTNDLTKSTFDVSRDEADSQQYFNMLQPDLLKEISEIFASAVKYKKPVSVCGELAKDPKFMLFVLAESTKYDNPNENFYPFVNLSMSAVSTPQAKEILRTIADNGIMMTEIRDLFSDLDNITADELDGSAADIYAGIRQIILDKPEVQNLLRNIEKDFLVNHPDLADFVKRHNVEDAFAQAA